MNAWQPALATLPWFPIIGDSLSHTVTGRWRSFRGEADLWLFDAGNHEKVYRLIPGHGQETNGTWGPGDGDGDRGRHVSFGGGRGGVP